MAQTIVYYPSQNSPLHSKEAIENKTEHPESDREPESLFTEKKRALSNRRIKIKVGNGDNVWLSFQGQDLIGILTKAMKVIVMITKDTFFVWIFL